MTVETGIRLWAYLGISRDLGITSDASTPVLARQGGNVTARRSCRPVLSLMSSNLSAKRLELVPTPGYRLTLPNAVTGHNNESLRRIAVGFDVSGKKVIGSKSA